MVERPVSRGRSCGQLGEVKSLTGYGKGLEALLARRRGAHGGRDDSTACADGSTMGDGPVDKEDGKASGKTACPPQRRLAEGKVQKGLRLVAMKYPVHINTFLDHLSCMISVALKPRL